MTTTTSTNSKKSDRYIYWIATLLIVLFDSGGSLFFNTQMAIDGIRHLGFPDYFRVELAMGKIIGGIILLVPMIRGRLKEWTYAAFGITFISAAIGHLAVGDGVAVAAQPLIGLAIMIVSYIYYHKLKNAKESFDTSTIPKGAKVQVG
jgi:DoxX-like protein